jgi:seryl-tRNA synthetase
MVKRYDPEGDDAWMSSRQDGDYVDHSDYAALERELEEAREWKESAMTVFSKLDLQAIGKEIGVKLGEDISPKVLPAIKELKRELEEAERERDRLKGALEEIADYPNQPKHCIYVDYSCRLLEIARKALKEE